jgi:hypothetical protein
VNIETRGGHCRRQAEQMDAKQRRLLALSLALETPRIRAVTAQSPCPAPRPSFPGTDAAECSPHIKLNAEICAVLFRLEVA